MLGTTPPRFCSSEGMMILVALPLATLASASRLRMASTLSVGMASFSRRMASALAFCTARMAWASPSASRMRCCLTASARRMAASFSPSAAVMAACFSPSAFRMTARFSRSAFICFSMASWISRGGMMFFTSTRLTLMPHLSVASSRMAVILPLMTSRLVRVWSSSISPMMLRRVVADRLSMAAMGWLTP